MAPTRCHPGLFPPGSIGGMARLPAQLTTPPMNPLLTLALALADRQSWLDIVWVVLAILTGTI